MSIGAGPQMSKFPYGFQNGISIRGIPLVQTHSGLAFWVSNNTALPTGGRGASDGNSGSFLNPCSTLQGAIDKCVAARGDTIFVKAGHVEAITSATALTLNKSNVAIVGLGSGSSRPTFTISTANTSTVNVTADNVSINNCVFVGGFLNIAALFTLTTAKYFTLEGVDVFDSTVSLNFLKIVTTSTTDNAADGLMLSRCRFVLLAASGATALLVPNGNMAAVQIQNCYYQSLTTGTGAVIPIAAGKILTGFLMLDNLINVVNAAGTATAYLITTNGSTNTGFLDGNKDHALPTTPLLVTASSGFSYGLNWHSNTADLQGYLVPAADS